MRALTLGIIGSSVAVLVMFWFGVAGAQQTPAATTAVVSQTGGDMVVRPDGPGPFTLAHFYRGYYRPYRSGFYRSWYPYYGGYYRPYGYYYRPYKTYGKSCYWNGYSYICSYPSYRYNYW